MKHGCVAATTHCCTLDVTMDVLRRFAEGKIVSGSVVRLRSMLTLDKWGRISRGSVRRKW